ncbi:MAG TPA: FKBP-type peptidyl-prolyl cis-trans isomerase [Candidatus Angelobacter sp.]|nr:FKBP-type peptidyl-prolyl cis-trans isomerase [Candidatus Angelobacter sp.]
MLKPTSISWTFVLLLLAASGAAFAQGGSTHNHSQTNTQAAPPQAPQPKSQASGSAAQESPFKTNKEKASYALGMNVGASLRRQGVDIDPAIFAQGMKDAMAGNKTLITEEEGRAALIQLQSEVQSQAAFRKKTLADANKKEGDAFLAANKAKPGVVTLPSGLQYKILKEGTGPKPTTTDTVKCNYKGTLVDGTEFDSSEKHGGPATFPVNGVIKGWTEALQLMPVGSKWQLVIPPDLAYGDRGAPGGQIGPNATLVFEVELLSIEPKTP